MKTKAGLLVFMCALAVFGRPAFGQIIIDSADVSAKLAVGDSLVYWFDTHTDTLNIGLHGPTSWDFSTLRSDSSQKLKSVAVAGSPFNGSFPGATHIFQTNVAVVVPALGSTPIPAIAYIYFQLSSSRLLNFGEGAIGTGMYTGASAVITNVPADLYYKLPLTYGTTWTSVFFDTTVISIPPFPPVPEPGVRHSELYTVDAYGRMKLPDLSLHDALRIKKSDSTASGKLISYIFLARDGASVQADALNLSGPDSGVIQTQGPASWNTNVFTLLPIELVSFNASLNTAGSGVVLRWSTLSEVNNYGFEVQRGSLPGGDFASIPGSFVPGHGTTTVPRTYSYNDASAPAGTWYYRLKQIDLDGTFHYSDPAKVDVQPGGTAQDVPSAFSLGQNFPNPFNPETTIRYGIPSRGHVDLSVYNILGERVAVLVDGDEESGFHDVRFDGSSLASGVYFYRLRSAGFVQTRKLSLLK